MTKKILCAVLIITIVLSLASCRRKYPDYLTGEYVQEHYELVDMNLVYLQTYRRRTNSIRHPQGPFRARFMEIKGVPLNQFLGLESHGWRLPYEAYVVSNSESSVNPIYDFEIKKIELYGKRQFKYIDRPDTENYGKKIYSKQLYEITDSEVVGEILDSIQYAERDDIYAPILKDGGEIITLRIHFKEYENIVWDAEVGERDGKYYLRIILGADILDEEHKIFSRDYDYDFIYIGPQFDALMESLFAADL